MNRVVITKGKLLKGDKVTMGYYQVDKDGFKTKHDSVDLDAPPHEDLKNAIHALTLHAAVINEFIEVLQEKHFLNGDGPHQKELEKFNATGFTIVNAGESDESVILTATKTNKNGKPWMFNTTMVSFNDTSESVYAFSEDLRGKIETAREEMKKYLNGKKAAGPQQSLFPEEKKDEPVSETKIIPADDNTETKAPRKRSSKKKKVSEEDAEE